MSKLEVGKLALIVGARTEHGRQFIGRVVTLEAFVEKMGVLRFKGITFKLLEGEGDSWIVTGDVVSPTGRKGISFYQEVYLIPLEDPDYFKEFEKDLEKVL